MLLLLDGNSEIGARMKSVICSLQGICLEWQRDLKQDLLFSHVRNVFWVTILYKYLVALPQGVNLKNKHFSRFNINI